MTTPAVGLARVTLAVLAAAVTLTAQAHPLAAQYFGRNQVQYQTFDFQILRTPHFDIYYYPEAELATRDAARMAERWYERLSRLLGYELEQRQPLILYANHPDFQQNNIIGNPGEGTQGATEPFKQRIVMPFMHSYAETDHLIGHEMVHAFQFDISGIGRAGGGLESAARRYQVPLWFSEGMAEYLSSGPVDPNTAMTLRDAALEGDIPSIEQMTYGRYFAYTWGHALWAYVGGRWGDAAIGQILKQAGQGIPYPEAFQRILNISLEELSNDFQTSVRRAYLPLLVEHSEAREIAEPLLTDGSEGGGVNLAPALSPAGDRVAFLSSLSGLDIELYVADAETGEVIRRLVRGTAFDPHFGSLRFINSAGTWSPDGERLAFSALRKGADVLVILEAGSARILREFRISEVGEITNPTWSPDGRTIVFSGLRSGVTDLYALDLETGESRQLTDDRYADLHPAFSPDGSTIAFATDRGEATDFEVLRYPGYRIALMDVSSGAIRIAPAMDASNNVNPAWARDGASLYFVSSRTGIPNIYRVELASGELFRVTDLFTGVAGITDLSPAITTARNGNRLLFAAFENTGYNIYSMEEAEALAGVPVSAATLAVADTAVRQVAAAVDTSMTQLPAADTMVATAALLPPIPRPEEAPFRRVAEYLADADEGLPAPAADTAYEVAEYTPRLTLDWLGQPQVGVAVGGGAFSQSGLYGGITGIFSDMLGRHTVLGAVQAQGQLDEIGFAAVYLNRRTRWNYGAAAQRVPFVYPLFRIVPTSDPSVFEQQYIRARFFDTSLQGLARYPFSQVQRVEFSAGFRRIARDFQIFGQFIDRNGFPLSRWEESEENLGAHNLGEGSVALVYDNALFGYTSPFAGQRYRLEISPTIGDLQYVQALVDYRRYFWLRPLTLAIRGLHFGRYGEDLNDPIFGSGVFLGYPSLIRGYSSVGDDCFSRGRSCAVMEQLYGSRIGVLNAELRFPLVRALVLGVGNIGFPPIEGIAFFDAGVAWGTNPFDREQETRPVLKRGIQGNPLERGFLTSAGVGARVNLFGYFILEVDYVRPFERDDGWHWQFAVQPGF